MRGVIFDLDGTLIDSLRDIADALDHVLAERNLPQPSYAEVERMVGDGARILVRRALGERLDLEEEVLTAFKARYFANLTVHTRPYEGIEALLTALKERGTPMAVLSNKPHPATASLVAALFPEVPFIEVRGAREEHLKKPCPTVALEIADRMELAPEAILFVGDTAIDVETAARARMTSVGVLWGMRPREELERAGATHLIGSPAELLSLL